MSKTYYLSKYALSDGIKVVEADDVSDGYVRPDGYYWISFKLGRDIHETEAAAKAAAESMRLKKIASLKKQIAKLEAMKF